MYLTVSDAAARLREFFQNNNVFTFEQHFHEVVPICVDEALEAAIIAHALKLFEQRNLVTRLDVEKKTAFVLNRKLEHSRIV